MSAYPNPTLHEGPNGLELEGVSLVALAERHGTPSYVYSREALSAAYRAYASALEGHRARIFYAVKANSNLAVLNLFARLGAGFDIVSGGELSRVLAAGGKAGEVVFSGVGKSAAEMRQALEAGIRCFNVESAAELERLAAIAAQMGKVAPIALRVNPDVDPKTHPYISTGLRSNKFGVAFDEAMTLYRRAATLPGLEVSGIACHIGSQLLDPAPVAEAADKILGLVDRLAAEGIALDHIDLGGGLGIRYKDETPPSPAAYLAPLLERFSGRSEEICLEPGRSLIGNAGLLLTRIEYLKPGVEKNFAVVDAAMNDLARPALYDAFHDVVAVCPGSRCTPQRYEIVGPICESGDFLAHDRELNVAPGELLALLSAGAYGMTMSSNYNTRPRAAEVMVDGNRSWLIREREHGTVEHLLVMPVTPFEIMSSKVWAMALVVLAATAFALTAVVQGWLSVPIQGSLALFLAGAALHLFATTSMGIFLGTVARSMPQFALLLMLVLLPLQMLSGGSTPRESMPEAVQYIMLAAPNTHFVMLAQAILYRGAGFAAVWPQFLSLAAIGAVLFTLALTRFRKTLATMA